MDSIKAGFHTIYLHLGYAIEQVVLGVQSAKRDCAIGSKRLKNTDWQGALGSHFGGFRADG